MTVLKLPVIAPACDHTHALRIGDAQAETLAKALKALGHPVRLQMLDLIAQGGGETCGCDIEAHFELTQPTISHHLKVLRDANLITSEARGVWVYHRVNPATFAQVQAVLSLLMPAPLRTE
jgi:ArsR family transcriptional regulator